VKITNPRNAYTVQVGWEKDGESVDKIHIRDKERE